MNISKLPSKMKKIAQNGKKLLYDNRREIMAVYEGAKKGHEQLGKTIKFLEEVAIEVRNENLDKAEQIYKRKFIRMSHNSSAKRVFTVGELSKFLNDKNGVIKTLDKLKKAKRVMDQVMKPLEKSISIYKKTSKAIGMANDAYKLLEQSKKLSNANDYRRYNLEVAKQFGNMCSIMKGITSKLPAGMSDYCNFIFTVGEKTETMAKMVSDYTQKILKEIKGAKSEWDNVFQSKTSNTYKSKQWGDMYKSGDDNQELDALLGRP